MTKESKILRIVKEDILRILGERQEKISLESLKRKIKVQRSFLSEAIRALKEENLIWVEGKIIRLTKKAQSKAKDIVKKHLVLENYLKKTRSKKEAHKTAHILEHYVSEEVIDNIKKLSTLKKEEVSLVEFKQKEYLITNIILGIKLFERIISMGIVPGEKIKTVKEIPNGIIIGIENKKIVLDKNIAKKIKVIEYERS